MEKIYIGVLIITALIIIVIYLLTVRHKLKRLNREKDDTIQKLLQGKKDMLNQIVVLNEEARLLEKQNLEIHIKQKDFLREVLHEMRIPMSVVKGYADILLDGLIQDEEQQKKYLIKIGEKTEYINQLISNCFFSSQMVKDELGVSDQGEQFGYYDLIQKIQEISNDFELAAKSKGVNITISTSEKTAHVYCDIIKITQVISNLISNSLKYMEKSGTIQISLAYSGKNDITLIVRDNGNGLSKKHIANIFEKGSKFHNMQNGMSKEGQGFGLYICRVNRLQ